MFRGPAPHRAVVREDDRVDDRQPEARAAPAALAASLAAPEALEEHIRVGVRQPRPVVADLHPHLLAVAPHRHLDRRAARGVDERVAQEVAEHLAELMRIAAGDGGRVGVELDAALGRGGARVIDGVARQGAEVDLLPHGIADLVEAREA